MSPTTWCDECGEIRDYPHDCPYRGGVRIVTPKPVKARWGWRDALWLGPLVVAAAYAGWNWRKILFPLFDWWYGS